MQAYIAAACLAPSYRPRRRSSLALPSVGIPSHEVVCPPPTPQDRYAQGDRPREGWLRGPRRHDDGGPPPADRGSGGWRRQRRHGSTLGPGTSSMTRT
jgi:hypothetical protein